MRRLLGTFVAGLVVCAGCTSGSDEQPSPAPASPPALSLASLDLGWSTAQGKLDAGDPPPAPEGVNPLTYERMAADLASWARVTTVDDSVWHAAKPVDAVSEVLPARAAAALRKQARSAVSPRLAVANVFADDVTVLGTPQVSTAWQVSQADDEDGKPYVVLELQTRAAYEVRLGSDGPVRVIGMLRVHGLSAYADTTDDFGVSGGWQEFGAGDCALALDDQLVPESDLEETRSDLQTFQRVGDADDVEMPDLGDDEQVDADYLQRCRAGQV
ncbi:hypothetical protein GEV29_00980 [Aeromicrobium sp. SMF47]|uniref:Uncharacterized protein n=1 Tax=Aeromicrobium yanjiei TaxID=2662028 RepID=A0A5Q2MJC5_9ACTN|nr:MULTISPECIES: hypothetical protein [Aeromicrobium]MRJ75102.1 hypothetical protein [Aeromicrobium yanjiei]MRK02842.1 hypothetical protein [Aeromicrobium sp. S22]QGG40415.1 hypothetical protein GEV26_02980 [Aeromicrobium yanjiei]